MKYSLGTKVTFVYPDGFKVEGLVVENFKLPGDVCVKWETGQTISYDEAWLDQMVKVKND